ncbi:MAG: hypothetical protein CR994_00615 [Maribacter sp.]|nr:MAG: hypothetical protein CR994_00615 [Maribacter sp.]
MKKAFVLVALIIGSTAMAQNRGNCKGNPMKNMTVEQMATLQTKKMTLDLDLTQDQQTKIQALNLENAKKRKVKMDKRRELMDSGERPTRSSEEVYALETERLDAAIAHKAALKKILDEDQYARWETLQRKRRGCTKMRGERFERKK